MTSDSGRLQYPLHRNPFTRCLCVTFLVRAGDDKAKGPADTGSRSARPHSWSPWDMVVIEAPGVTLDVGGFAVLGPVTCSGVAVTECTPEATATGIVVANHNQVHGGTTAPKACSQVA